MRIRWVATWILLLAGAAVADRGPGALRDAAGLLAAGDTLAAIDVLERSRLADQADPAAALLLGRLLRERGTIPARFQSQQVLEDARRRHPRSPDVELELGRTYMAQRFFAPATACFQNVLEIDPSRCDARYLLGACHFEKWRRVNDYTDEAASARRHLRAALECDGGNPGAAFMLLVAGYALGDSNTAAADHWLAQFPQRGEFHLYRGVLAFEQGRYADCEAHFARGLALLPEDRCADYGNLGRVLAGGDAVRYEEASPERRAVLSRAYWLSADPDATTEVNERSLEHVYRVFLADVLFSNEWTGRRGCRTDRGEVFVKFGPPVALDRNLGDDPGSGRVELWSYAIGGVFHRVLFVDEFLNGDPRIPRLADEELNFIRNTGGESALPPRLRAIDAAIDVTVFRDDDLSASAYVAMGADAEALEKRAGAVPTHLVARAAYFDEEWNREGGFTDLVRTADVARPLGNDSLRVELVRRMRLPFGRYHVACALEADPERARATARADTDASRFALDTLSVSDVLLFEPPAPGAADPRARTAGAIERGGYRMVPRIGHRYAEGETVQFYAEIYHLSAPGGTARYDVRISIAPAPERHAPVWEIWAGHAGEFLGLSASEPVIAQQYRREGHGHTAHERVAIAVDALAPGSYDLMVEITDTVTGARASSWTPLEKIGGDAKRRR
jgi:GWxTD domain-containing protein